MQPTLPSGLYSILKVAILTFFGAFLGAVSMTTMPATLDGWKAIVMPALGAAIAAELVFLRTTIAQALTGVTPQPAPAPAPTPAAKVDARGFVQLRALVLALIAGAFALLVVACTTLQAAFPFLDKVEQVVAADLANGASDAQMASDVCAALGGSSTTDAICASSERLIQDVIVALVDSGVLKGKAAENGHAYLARHPMGAR